MTAEGIDIYRQDCNFTLIGYWRANDAPDRQGITEIRHVAGYLAYWDDLRRPKSPCESARFPLRGLDPAASYEVRDVDTDTPAKFTGQDLMDKGLLVTVPHQPGAAIVFYKRLK